VKLHEFFESNSNASKDIVSPCARRQDRANLKVLQYDTEQPNETARIASFAAYPNLIRLLVYAVYSDLENSPALAASAGNASVAKDSGAWGRFGGMGRNYISPTVV
jgi:hypothetical protein